MAFKMKYKNLQKVVDELRSAVKAHGKQADTIENHIDKMENSPMKKGREKVVKKEPLPNTRKETKMIVRERNVNGSVLKKKK